MCSRPQNSALFTIEPDNSDSAFDKRGNGAVPYEPQGPIHREPDIGLVGKLEVADCLMQDVLDARELQLQGDQFLLNRHPSVEFVKKAGGCFLNEFISFETIQFQRYPLMIKEV
jgi:hypothetical protein